MSGKVTLMNPLNETTSNEFDLQRIGGTNNCESLVLDFAQGEFVENITIHNDNSRV